MPIKLTIFARTWLAIQVATSSGLTIDRNLIPVKEVLAIQSSVLSVSRASAVSVNPNLYAAPHAVDAEGLETCSRTKIELTSWLLLDLRYRLLVSRCSLRAENRQNHDWIGPSEVFLGTSIDGLRDTGQALSSLVTVIYLTSQEIPQVNITYILFKTRLGMTGFCLIELYGHLMDRGPRDNRVNLLAETFSARIHSLALADADRNSTNYPHLILDGIVGHMPVTSQCYHIVSGIESSVFPVVTVVFKHSFRFTQLMLIVSEEDLELVWCYRITVSFNSSSDNESCQEFFHRKLFDGLLIASPNPPGLGHRLDVVVKASNGRSTNWSVFLCELLCYADHIFQLDLRGRPVIQSWTSGKNVAHRAVDGDLKTYSATHSVSQPIPLSWWLLDIEDNYAIHEIQIFWRRTINSNLFLLFNVSLGLNLDVLSVTSYAIRDKHSVLAMHGVLSRFIKLTSNASVSMEIVELSLDVSFHSIADSEPVPQLTYLTVDHHFNVQWNATRVFYRDIYARNLQLVRLSPTANCQSINIIYTIELKAMRHFGDDANNSVKDVQESRQNCSRHTKLNGVELTSSNVSEETALFYSFEEDAFGDQTNCSLYELTFSIVTTFGIEYRRETEIIYRFYKDVNFVFNLNSSSFSWHDDIIRECATVFLVRIAQGEKYDDSELYTVEVPVFEPARNASFNLVGKSISLRFGFYYPAKAVSYFGPWTPWHLCLTRSRPENLRTKEGILEGISTVLILWDATSGDCFYAYEVEVHYEKDRMPADVQISLEPWFQVNESQSDRLQVARFRVRTLLKRATARDTKWSEWGRKSCISRGNVTDLVYHLYDNEPAKISWQYPSHLSCLSHFEVWIAPGGQINTTNGTEFLLLARLFHSTSSLLPDQVEVRVRPVDQSAITMRGSWSDYLIFKPRHLMRDSGFRHTLLAFLIIFVSVVCGIALLISTTVKADLGPELGGINFPWYHLGLKTEHNPTTA